MDGDETPEDRLEAALERIAQVVASKRLAAADPPGHPGSDEVALRLDRIIETLRQALGAASET